MARRRFVIGQRRQRPRRVFGGVSQVDIISAGARAAERGYLVIAAWGAGLDLGRHAADVALRLGQTAEGFGQAALHFLDLLVQFGDQVGLRSEEHTSELQSLMRISYAVFCLKKKQPTTKA